MGFDSPCTLQRLDPLEYTIHFLYSDCIRKEGKGMRDAAFEPLYNRDWLSAFLKRSRLTPLGAGLILAALISRNR